VGTIGQNKGVIKKILEKNGKDLSTVTWEEWDKDGEVAQEEYLISALIVLGSDRT
jgi:hypothetical protein